jgi:hypothetical protein
MIAISDILKSKSRVEVLRRLCFCPDGMTGRALARSTGFSPQQTHNALGQLVDLGLVERRVISPSYLFRLNWANSITVEISRMLPVLDLPVSGAPADK